jgi:hypothetical protein
MDRIDFTVCDICKNYCTNEYPLFAREKSNLGCLEDDRCNNKFELNIVMLLKILNNLGK